MKATQPLPIQACIPVQPAFCPSGSEEIKSELEAIEGIRHVRLYPKDALVQFHFVQAFALSSALNALEQLGFNELLTT